MCKSPGSLFTLALLAASPLLAGDTGASCLRQGIAERTGVENIQVIENAPEPIYVDFGTELPTGERVRFEILVDGALSLTEEIELTKGDTSFEARKGAPVVELLAGQPARLEFLRRAAKTGTVEISLSLGGASFGRRTLSELEAQSTRLRASGVRPSATRSAVKSSRGIKQIFAESEDCQYDCEVAQDDCYYYQCGQFGSAACYGNCDMLYESCLENCGICQPSSSSQTTVTVHSTTPTSVVQCRRSFFNSSVTGHQRYNDRVMKQTVTTTTINSNCTETVTTQVSYYSTFCWQWIDFNSCSPVAWENPAANC